jgi:hypothetical protein
VIESPEMDKNFIVPKDSWLRNDFREKDIKTDIEMLKLTSSENDMGLDEIIIEKEVRKKV